MTSHEPASPESASVESSKEQLEDEEIALDLQEIDWLNVQTPAEAAEAELTRDRVADALDRLADASDEQAGDRDRQALSRDAAASARDRRARLRADDCDAGFADRFLAGVDRDLGAADRADAADDRRSASTNRERAAETRLRVAVMRAEAGEEFSKRLTIAERLIDDLQEQLAVHANEADNLQVALSSGRRIAIAVGVLMEQHKITREQAFDMLSEASMNQQVKLQELALEVVETGAIDPERPPKLFRTIPNGPPLASTE